MIEIRQGTQKEIPLQKALWQKVFGDGEDYLEEIYGRDTLFSSILLFEGGELGCMTLLYPMVVTLPKGGHKLTHYVYALATHPDRRGRGYAGMILSYVRHFAEDKGLDGVIVVPAQPSLHQFFGKHGFTPCFATGFSPHTLTSPLPVEKGDTIAPVSPEEYHALRETLLEGTLHVSYGRPLLEMQQGISSLFSGGLYTMTLGGVTGLVVAEKHSPTHVETKEFLLPDPLHPRGLALIKDAFPEATTVTLRTPVQDLSQEGAVSFGQAIWFGETQGTPLGYFGLAYD